MIQADWDTAAATITRLRLEQFRSQIRRRVLLKVGNQAAKLLLAEVKAADKPVVSGLLQKSFKKKVKAYAGSNVVFIAVGPVSKLHTVTEYKDYRTGRMRKWKAGQPRKGPKMANPAKYAHLAGKGRKSTFIQRTRARVADQIRTLIRDTLAAEVAAI